MEPGEVLLVAAVLLSLGFNWVYFLRHAWKKPSRLRSGLIKISLAFYALVFTLLPLEIIFGTVFIQPDNFTFTLAAEKWMDRHWEPENELDYRDKDHDNLDDKKVLLVIGDSFVAGHGIADYRKRFTSVLDDLLGDEWAVPIAAKNGWNTDEQFAGLLKYPHQSDAVLLSYFLNDIEDAAEKLGKKRPRLIEKPPKLIRGLVDDSYLFNYLYWKIWKRTYASSMVGKYAEYREAIYADENIWSLHQEEILNIHRYTQHHEIPLRALIFPDLFDVAGTAHLTDKVAALFREHDVPVIDLAPLLKDRPVEELVVGQHDGHPNEALHAEIAELLKERFFNNSGDLLSTPISHAND
jgi:hypothetical protein